MLKSRIFRNRRLYQHFTTDEIRHAKKYGKFYHLGAFCGLSAFGYFTFKYVEENQEEAHFAKRYPDPSLSTEVQQILIPKMMDTIARERICKRQYIDFENCVNDHGDPNRFNNKEEGWLKKFLEFTEGKGCQKERDAMHECSKKCLYDDDLYFEAKADYVRKRELFREAQVPYENAEYILESVKLGQKLYYTGRVWDQRNFHPDTIQFIRKHSKEHGTYNVYFNENDEFINEREEMLATEKPRQTAKTRIEELEREISEYETLLEKKNNQLPPIRFKTFKVLDVHDNPIVVDDENSSFSKVQVKKFQ
ncbi:unnamed protein product [Oikopleura dioica]|uniref:Uncharacterized protein n=1 Tax=Oikopleura dioica TaxID=34765 RepID=E4X2Y0_OIKDI|nr:unnamed protein product [Oikopleura dioica]